MINMLCEKAGIGGNMSKGGAKREDLLKLMSCNCAKFCASSENPINGKTLHKGPVAHVMVM